MFPPEVEEVAARALFQQNQPFGVASAVEVVVLEDYGFAIGSVKRRGYNSKAKQLNSHQMMANNTSEV